MSHRLRLALLVLAVAAAVPTSRAAAPPRPVATATPEGEAPTPEVEADAAAKPGGAGEEMQAAEPREGADDAAIRETAPGEAVEAAPSDTPEAAVPGEGSEMTAMPDGSRTPTDDGEGGPVGEPPRTGGEASPMPRPPFERPLAREPGRPPGRLPQRIEPGFAPPGFRRPPSSEGDGPPPTPAGPAGQLGAGEGGAVRRSPKPPRTTPAATAPAEAVVGLPPVEALTATRTRPLFVPGRRGPEVVEGLPAPSRPILAEPSDPTDVPLTVALSGVVSGPGVALAILIDPANNATMRLKTGEEHDGWTLVEIGRTNVTFRRGEQDTVLTLKPPGTTSTSTGGDPAATAPRGKRPPGRPGKPAQTGEESE